MIRKFYFPFFIFTVIISSEIFGNMSKERALELIAKEKKEKTGTLFFFNLKLTEIPEEILELKHLIS